MASALAMKCEEILSSDSRLKRIEAAGNVLIRDGLRVLRAKDTQCLPEKYRQLSLDGGIKH